jgi:phenylalanyl-tRNA synthetase beta chain
MRQEYDIQPLLRLRKIKSFFCSAANMIEQQNYAFFDEKFLFSIEFETKDALDIVNPVSENYKQLVTSLLPHLFKNVKDNFMLEDKLSFFEFGRSWKADGSMEEMEHKSLAGIFFNKREKVDFYECKYHLEQLFNLIGIDVSWKRLSKKYLPWQNSYQTAEIFFEDKKIGTAGKIDQLFFAKLDVLPQSDAFVFELDGDFLLNVKPNIKTYNQLSKYQETTFDLSFFVPLSVETSGLEVALQKSDPLIQDVSLLDFFEKDEWEDKRALAFRVRIGHLDKTLEKEEIEDVRQKVIQTVQKLGAELRS